MREIIDKRDLAAGLRDRLSQIMADSGETQSGLARAIGVDRSTVSQLLTDAGGRMPGAHLVAAAARHFDVSADWLLGLSEHQQMASDLVDASLQVTAATRALIDDQLFQWHQQAAGYKIRHVPTGLPDMLKTHQVLRWEYANHRNRSTEQAIEASERRLDWMRQTSSDLEIALPRQEIKLLASGEGYYRDLPADLRRAQLDHFAQVTDQLYPALRVCLYDARQLFSAPLTVFGPLMAAIYIGQNYLVFRDSERVRILTAHFDQLVRQAETGARELPALLRKLQNE
ncbi:helix-turn-helix domain-containing protein [Paracoccus sp. YLB-12]|uniref:Helix-turn-helix domain-containing protein n=1 Tax=Paracoccus maritimus TaxID=2933292 RepID=A0ABT2K8T7_9RHOB|nr:helix-turn-helix transcriptional regulator [Paracoccus sp. YLB-12]MCT4332936.1 helix-turn-helix domain-containing protein [Paracoccus sp. YLB-12]